MRPGPQIEIRPLTAPEQFRDAVDLQTAIWGFDDVDLLPVRFFIVVTKIGGQAFGAYDGDRMIAFCIAIPGIKRGDSTRRLDHLSAQPHSWASLPCDPTAISASAAC